METRSFKLSEVRFVNQARAKASADNADEDVEDMDDDEDERSLVVGYAAPFNASSQDMGGYVEQIAPGAFTRSLTEASVGQRNIVAIWEHDLSGVPLASTRSGMQLEQDDKGLKFSFDPRRLSTAQADAIASGDMQVSVGFFMNGYGWSEMPDGEYIRTVTDAELVEFSFVLFPAYTQTEASVRSFTDFKQRKAAEAKTPTEQRVELRDRVMKAYVNTRLNTRI